MPSARTMPYDLLQATQHVVDLDDYRLLEVINKGGQGVVYKALQKSTGRLVAVKILLDGAILEGERAKRFSREVNLISRIRHPHIVTLFGSGTVHGRPYYAMEFVDGVPIDDYVFVNRYTVPQTIALFEKVCRAVGHVHECGILHRDLKPGNILVDLDGEPCILDFGLAKSTGLERADTLVSNPGGIVGTLPFLSPEQAAGDESSVDQRSDIYALGVILYRLLTGVMPYPVSDDPIRMRRRILEESPSPMRRATASSDDLGATGRLSDDIARVTLKALAKEPHRRYASAADFADDLARYLRGEAVRAKADSFFYVLRRKLHRHRGAVLAGVLLLSVLLAAGSSIILLRQRSEEVTRQSQAGLNMGSFLRLGSTRRDANRIDQAVAMFEKVIEIGSSIPRPNVVDLRMLHDAHYYLAQIYLDDPAAHTDCAAHLEKAFECAQRLSALAPHDPVARRSMAFTLSLRGQWAMKKQAWVAALMDFTQSVQLFQSLTPSELEPNTRDSDVSLASHYLAKALYALEHYDEAMERLKVVRQTYLRLHEQVPDHFDYLLELALAECRLAAWCLKQRDEAGDLEACDYLRLSRERMAAAIDSGLAEPRIADARRLLNVLEKNQALADKRSFQNAEALKRVEVSIGIAR